MLRLELLLEAVDRLTGPMRAIQARMAGLRQVAERLGQVRGAQVLGQSLRMVGATALESARQVMALRGRVMALFAATGLSGGAAIWGFNRQLIRPAADLEQLALRVQTAMGSAAGGQQAMTAIREFARANNQSLTDVAAAFLALRTQGITPTARELAALGNAAGATGTSYEAAANALTGAMAGQFSQLRAYGIQARTEGNRVFLEWEAQGRRMRAVVAQGNRAGLGAAVTQAFTDRFPQGMQQAAETWDGMLARMGEAVREFSRMVMEAGVFDYLRDRMRDILAAVNRLTADGTLQRWATETAAVIMRVFGAIESFLTAGEGQAESPFMAMLRRIQEMTQPLADVAEYFGGVETALFGIGLVLTAPFLASLAALGVSVTALGVALLGTPAGWFALAAAGITALALALRNNWGGITDWLRDQLRAIQDLGERALGSLLDGPLSRLSAMAATLREAWSGIGSFFEGLFDGIEGRARTLADAVRNLLRLLPGGQRGDLLQPFAPPPGPRIGPAPAGPTLDGRPPAASGLAITPGFMNNLVPPGGLGPAPAPTPSAPPVRIDAGGELRLRLEDNRAPRLDGQMNDRRIRITPDQGLMMGVP